MRVRTYIYNSTSGPDGDTPEHVQAVLDSLADREESVELVDVGAGEDARREAMFALREAVRIGENPDEIYGPDGTPEFATGALVTEDDRGRRSLHVGRDALDALGIDSGNGE